MLNFLRNINKRAVVLIVQRVLAAAVSAKPYAACGYAPRCPCPMAVPQETTGVAIGDAVTMNLGGGRSCPRERIEFPAAYRESVQVQTEQANTDRLKSH